jgi:hypothetical protein
MAANPFLHRTIRQEWLEYVERVGLRGAHATQLVDTRRAFYAGAIGMQQCMIDVSGPGVTEDEGARFFEARRQECLSFWNEAMAGRDNNVP